jgi:hypothetical protein
MSFMSNELSLAPAGIKLKNLLFFALLFLEGDWSAYNLDELSENYLRSGRS